MQNEVSICNERLKNVLVIDKKDNTNKILNVLKSDILYVLKNYMEINNENLEVNISITQLGTYQVTILADVSRLKILNCIE